MKYEYKIGDKFGKLTIIDIYRVKTPTKTIPNKTTLFFTCLCECGEKKNIKGYHVLSGSTKSCGCNGGVVKDLTNKVFGRLKVIKRAENTKNNQAQWLCECECGNTTIVRTSYLNNGHTKSCGCLNIEASTKHGDYKTKLYRVYLQMKDRCNNPKNDGYKNYGGRGIKVCKEWSDDFTIFKEWSLQNGYIEGLTLDRIDFNKGYEPSNCRWITNKEQQHNKSTNVFITHNGETKTLAQWSEIYDIYSSTAKHRLDKGMSFEDAFDKNLGKHLYEGEYRTLKEIAILNNINPKAFAERVRKGMTIEEAISCKRKKYLYNGEYVTLTEIARLNNIHHNTFRERVRKGMTIEEAINYKR